MLSLRGLGVALLGAIEGAPEVATTNGIGGTTGAVAVSQALFGAVIGRSAGGVDLG